MMAIFIIPIILALTVLYLHKHLSSVNWEGEATPLKLYNWEIILAIVVLLIPIVNIFIYFILLIIYIAGIGCGDLKLDKKSKFIEWLNKDALKK